MHFKYRSVTPEGRIVRGRLDARNLDELEARLRHRGYALLSAKSVPSGRFFLPRRLPRRELIHFCFHLDHLVRAGVPLLDSLNDLRESVEPGLLQETLDRLVEAIEGGLPLSQAMRAQPGAFAPLMVSLIHAGESSGRLPEVLGELTESLKWEDELASHTRKLLMYPALVSGVVLAATSFLMIHMVPQLKSFILNMGQALPIHTRMLFGISDFLLERGHWLPLPPLCGLIAGQALLRYSPQARERLDAIKLSLPVFGPILSKIILSRLAATLAMLYAAGMPIVEALGTTREVAANRAMDKALQGVERAIHGGEQLAPAFLAAGLFPPLVVRMLRVGENTGNLDKALLNVAYFYNRDVKEAIGRAQSMIEPALTVVLGLLLGWIMLAVIGPIYDIIGRLAP